MRVIVFSIIYSIIYCSGNLQKLAQFRTEKFLLKTAATVVNLQVFSIVHNDCLKQTQQTTVINQNFISRYIQKQVPP